MGKHGIRIPQNYAPRFRLAQILGLELEALWTYQFLCEICERVTSAVSTMFADIMLSNEDMKSRVNLWKYSLSSCNDIIWEKWGKLDWWMRWADEWLKSLSWLQEIIEAHVTLLTSLMKNSSFFGQSDGWWNVEYFQKTGRCYIRGSRIVPSSQKLATFCHHPTMQIKWQVKNLNLKSKIGLQWTMQWIKDSNILIKQGEQLKETVEWWKYELN